MSVIVTLSMKGDPKRLQEYAAGDRKGMQAIVESAKAHGLIAHRFYGSADGEIMVADQWPDEESFKTFFAENGGKIGPMMQAAGVEGEPQPKFWQKLDTHDDYGWNA